ncbi:MAG: hypothetical protein AMXMBFR47_04000 [Planctomycetota bacterium]
MTDETREIEALKPIAVDPADFPDFSWPRLFGSDRPVEVEIGIGKGTFLLRRARALPEVNFFGIEWANEFYRYSVDRMQRWNVPNVRIVRTDASLFIRNHCPPASIAVLHVYHPDPWPKKRHHKRRLFQRPFVDAAVRCLVPGGRLAVQTDHAEYFEIIQGLLRSTPDLEEVPFEAAEYGVDEAGLGTNFEVKYLREGRSIYRIACLKVAPNRT